jgi:hypothetical protein
MMTYHIIFLHLLALVWRDSARTISKISISYLQGQGQISCLNSSIFMCAESGINILTMFPIHMLAKTKQQQVPIF